jgi:hypothetical protein
MSPRMAGRAVSVGSGLLVDVHQDVQLHDVHHLWGNATNNDYMNDVVDKLRFKSTMSVTTSRYSLSFNFVMWPAPDMGVIYNNSELKTFYRIVTIPAAISWNRRARMHPARRRMADGRCHGQHHRTPHAAADPSDAADAAPLQTWTGRQLRRTRLRRHVHREPLLDWDAIEWYRTEPAGATKLCMKMDLWGMWSSHDCAAYAPVVMCESSQPWLNFTTKSLTYIPRAATNGKTRLKGDGGAGRLRVAHVGNNGANTRVPDMDNHDNGGAVGGLIKQMFGSATFMFAYPQCSPTDQVQVTGTGNWNVAEPRGH